MSHLARELFGQTNLNEEVQDIRSVGGGSINDSYLIETKNNRLFMKVHSNAPEDFFQSEKRGLENISETNTISVPKVIDYSDEANRAFLLMEWVQGRPNKDTEQLLGQNLAKLHQQFHSLHGLKENSYLGTLPVYNQLCYDWVDYYRDYRLKSQLDIGVERNQIHGVRRKKLMTLMDHLDQWIPRKINASYLHGDLWGGNWIVGPEGEPYLIDPSFLYGDRLFELAFTEVFGGFSQQFYHSYEEVFPIEDCYVDVKELYQLYYLLAHLNMFGESYGAGVDRILNRYVPK